MGEILKEFKIALSLNLKDFIKELGKAESEASRIGERIKDLLSGFISYKSIQDFVNLGSKIKMTSDLLGVNSEQFEYLSRTLQIFDGDMNSAKSAISSLNQAMQDLKYGQGPLIELSGKYGIALRKSNGEVMNSMELLQSLASRFETLDTQSRVDLGHALGLDESVILLLSRGRKEFDRLIQSQKQFGNFSKKDQELSLKFKESLISFQSSLESISRTVGSVLLPPLTKFFNLTSDIFKKIATNRMFILTFFGALTTALLGVSGAALKVALSMARAYAPFALIAGAALVIQDIWGYFNGWDSVTGDLVKKYKILVPILDFIKPTILSIGDAVQDLIKWFEVPTWDNFKNFWIEVGKLIINVGNMIQKLGAYIYDFIIGRLNKLLEWAGFDTIKFSFTNAVEKQREMTIGYLNSLKSSPANQTNNNNTITQNFNVNSPQQAAEIGGKLLNQVNGEINRMGN